MGEVKPSGSEQPNLRTALVVERNVAKTKLEALILRAGHLLGIRILDESGLAVVERDFLSWEEHVYAILRLLFSTNEYVNDLVSPRYSHDNNGSFTYHTRRLGDVLTRKISKLESIRDQLELIPESPSITHAIVVSESKMLPVSKRIFIVHGHDNEAKQTVARFVEKLGLEAIVLHEQTDGGKTIIEKVEGFSDVAFAIILHTPDDVGNSKSDHDDGSTLKERSRQNVVFDMDTLWESWAEVM
jgi:hypothetical protein